MAPKQRAAKSDSSKMNKSDDRSDGFCLEMSSSDDEAPEEVTFEDSKAQALRSVELALKDARREKDLLKEKRKKRQELFQEQKRRKLLSAELLEEIDASEKQSQQEAGDVPQDDMRQETKRRKKKRLHHSKKLKANCKVTMAKNQASASFQQKAAEDFLQSRLYGAGSCRVTSTQLLSLQNKTARTKGAAIDFVKSQWALKQKSKAEKLNLRWIRKHVPSS
nr:nucleolar protein 7-like [Nerophis lumbriciformis]